MKNYITMTYEELEALKKIKQDIDFMALDNSGKDSSTITLYSKDGIDKLDGNTVSDEKKLKLKRDLDEINAALKGFRGILNVLKGKQANIQMQEFHITMTHEELEALKEMNRDNDARMAEFRAELTKIMAKQVEQQKAKVLQEATLGGAGFFSRGMVEGVLRPGYERVKAQIDHDNAVSKAQLKRAKDVKQSQLLNELNRAMSECHSQSAQSPEKEIDTTKVSEKFKEFVAFNVNGCEINPELINEYASKLTALTKLKIFGNDVKNALNVALVGAFSLSIAVLSAVGAAAHITLDFAVTLSIAVITSALSAFVGSLLFVAKQAPGMDSVIGAADQKLINTAKDCIKIGSKHVQNVIEGYKNDDHMLLLKRILQGDKAIASDKPNNKRSGRGFAPDITALLKSKDDSSAVTLYSKAEIDKIDRKNVSKRDKLKLKHDLDTINAQLKHLRRSAAAVKIQSAMRMYKPRRDLKKAKAEVKMQSAMRSYSAN